VQPLVGVVVPTAGVGLGFGLPLLERARIFERPFFILRRTDPSGLRIALPPGDPRWSDRLDPGLLPISTSISPTEY